MSLPTTGLNGRMALRAPRRSLPAGLGQLHRLPAGECRPGAGTGEVLTGLRVATQAAHSGYESQTVRGGQKMAAPLRAGLERQQKQCKMHTVNAELEKTKNTEANSDDREILSP